MKMSMIPWLAKILTSPDEPEEAAVVRGLDNPYPFEAGGHDEPPIGANPPQEFVRWGVVFSFFLRVLAVIWMLKGFGSWATILGLGDLPLVEETRLRQAICVSFAILHCSSAVGLWLLSPWGKSLWIFVALSEILLGFTGYGQSVSMVAAFGTFCLFLLFLLLSFTERHLVR